MLLKNKISTSERWPWLPDIFRTNQSCTLSPGGGGSCRTLRLISYVGEISSITASWWVALVTSRLLTDRIRSPIFSLVLEAAPSGTILDTNTPGSSIPNGWLEWSLPPTILRPSGPPALTIVTTSMGNLESTLLSPSPIWFSTELLVSTEFVVLLVSFEESITVLLSWGVSVSLLILFGFTIMDDGSFICEYADGADSFLISEVFCALDDDDTLGVEVRLKPGYTKVGGRTEVVGGVFQSEDILGLFCGEAGFGECWEEKEEPRDGGEGYV